MKVLVSVVVGILLSAASYGFEFDGLGAGSSLESVSEFLRSKGDAIETESRSNDGLDVYAVKRKVRSFTIERIFFCNSRLVGANTAYLAVSPFEYLKYLSKTKAKNGPEVFDVSTRDISGREVVSMASKWTGEREAIVLEFSLFNDSPYGNMDYINYVVNECGFTR